MSPFAYRLRFYDLAGTVLDSAQYLEENNKILEEMMLSFQKALSTDAYNVIMGTLEEYVNQLCLAYKQLQSSSNTILNQGILEYIQVHLEEEQLGPEQVAEHFNMNKAYIRQFFKEQNGIAFWEYINTRRVEKIKRQLMHSNKSVREISENFGYVSISTFSRAFKKHVGMTPGQYRKLARFKENQDNMTN